MFNFEWYNPTRVVFGKGTIPQLKRLLPKNSNILMIYGGGSIKKNGVYQQVKKALSGHKVEEFSGIEANPRYETCMKAVDLAKKKKVTFLLAVGGGSVGDATKFIAAAVKFKGRDPWDILAKHAPVEDALPLACVLTLPATGTEANPNAVISRDSTQEKLPFASDKVRPVFSILDPETTYTLDKRQTANGVVDAFVHVTEQYVTFMNDSPLQDRQAEAILLTLIEQGPLALKKPKDYAVRANIMYCAYQALNLHLAMGCPTDFATHDIGHELTALYGVDHAVSLAIVQPGVWQYDRKRKADKLVQYAERVWGIKRGTKDAKIKAAIAKTDKFYRSMGIKTTLKEWKIAADAPKLVGKRLKDRGIEGFGEHHDIGPKQAEAILNLRIK